MSKANGGVLGRPSRRREEPPGTRIGWTPAMPPPVPSLMARRRALLVAALGFVGLREALPEIRPLRAWLDTWTGLGAVAVGMARQGYDLQLTRYADRGWRATFYVSGMEHSAVTATGSAFEATPWQSVQRAASAVLSPARGA